MEEHVGLIDLLRDRYFDSEMTIRQRIRQRRLPKPFKIGGKLRWKKSVIDAWFENGTICWIPRSRNTES